VKWVAPGVSYMKIVRGSESGEDFYTVDVAFRAERASARQVAAQLEADGYDPENGGGIGPRPRRPAEWATGLPRSRGLLRHTGQGRLAAR
jgi:hypothetical protein